MAISFPTSPTVNQTYTSGSRTWSWNGTSWYLVAPSATVTVANTAPSTSVNGSLWLNSDTGDFLTYYNNGATTQWIQPVGGIGPTGPSGVAVTLSVGTTATRPSVPTVGAMRINSDTNYVELYYNSGWVNLTYIGVLAATSTNATITHVGNYAIHTFLVSGTFTPTSVPLGGTVEVLVVAGGGGGGTDIGGGGGGGGVLYNSSVNVTSGTISQITVGAGGAASFATADTGKRGSNSSFGATITSIGGGGGKSRASGVGESLGGSGGGGCYQNSTYGDATVGQGYRGGNGESSGGAGGGGGAAAVGADAVSGSGGNGGVGLNWQSVGTYYAGGGGGGQFGGSAGQGGLGGGGNGGAASVATAGSTNTGGGGGGQTTELASLGGKAGGSGIVIIKYRYQ